MMAYTERLQHADAAVRRLAVLDLAEAGDAAAVSSLADALLDADPGVRLEAVRGLEEFDGADVVAALLRALEDGSIREAAAEALAAKADTAALPQLLERAVHSDAFVRAAALRALKPLRSALAFPPALLGLRSRHACVRQAAVGVLGHLSADAALPALRQATADASPEVRRLAVAALAARGIAAWESLGDADWRVRQEAAEAVGKAQDGVAPAALLAVLDDPCWQVRQKAAWSLGRLGLAEAVPALGRLLLARQESNVRKEAAAALAAIGGAAALDWLRQALDDPDADVRKLAGRALRDSAPP